MKDGEVATQHAVNIKLVESDAVIGDAVLWTVVGANLFTPVASANQRLSRNGVCAALSLLFSGEKAAAQDRHPFLFIAQLAALVLHLHHRAARDVRDAHRRVSGVDPLSSVSGCALNINTNVTFRDHKVDRLSNGEHDHRCGARVNAPRGFGCGDALNAMHSRLPLEGGPCARSAHFSHRFAHATECRLAQAVHLHLPAASLRVAKIAAEEFTGEDPRLITARRRTHFNQHILAIVRIRVEQECGESLNQVSFDRLGGGALRRGEAAHLSIGARVKLHRLRIARSRTRRAQCFRSLSEWCGARKFAPDPCERRVIGEHLWLRQLRL